MAITNNLFAKVPAVTTDKGSRRQVDLAGAEETMVDWCAEEKARLKAALATETYTGPAGELRWKSNDAVIMLDTFRDAGVEPPAAQVAAREVYVEEQVAQMRAAEAALTPEERAEMDAETAFEMRAAFGPGEMVVNVLTGKVHKT